MLQRLVKREGDRVTQWGFLVNRGLRPWASWVYNNGGALVHKDEQGLATGLVDIKVCAVSDVWSGLKLVVRKELRAASKA